MNISEQLTNAIEEKQPVKNVRLLLENGADVNHQKPFKYSNLGLALQYKNEELIKLLLQYKANINAYDQCFIYKNIDVYYKKIIIKYAVWNNLDLDFLLSNELDDYLEACIKETELIRQMMLHIIDLFNLNKNNNFRSMRRYRSTIPINLKNFPIYEDIIREKINAWWTMSGQMN